MTEAERIDFLIQELEGNNAAEFARKINISRATVSKMRKGQVGIRLNIDSILAAYPQIKKDWLKTGEGYPGDLSVELVKTHYDAKIVKLESLVDYLITQLKKYEENEQ